MGNTREQWDGSSHSPYFAGISIESEPFSEGSVLLHSWLSCPRQAGAWFIGQLTSKNPSNGRVAAVVKAEWRNFAMACFPGIHAALP